MPKTCSALRMLKSHSLTKMWILRTPVQSKEDKMFTRAGDACEEHLEYSTQNLRKSAHFCGTCVRQKVQKTSSTFQKILRRSFAHEHVVFTRRPNTDNKMFVSAEGTSGDNLAAGLVMYVSFTQKCPFAVLCRGAGFDKKCTKQAVLSECSRSHSLTNK